MTALRSHAKTAAKTVSWRLFAGLDTFAVAMLSVTLAGGESHVAMASALGVVGLEVVTKLGWFYLHERAWESKLINKFFHGETK